MPVQPCFCQRVERPAAYLLRMRLSRAALGRIQNLIVRGVAVVLRVSLSRMRLALSIVFFVLSFPMDVYP